jgi:hypothetical protein
MPSISTAKLQHANQYVKALEGDGYTWRTTWRELSDNFLPQRYRWLLSPQELAARRTRRRYIINNTGTNAARTLAAGMMNGITSPARPWFKLRVPGIATDNANFRPLAIWLEQVEKAMLRVMAESNFYNSMAVLYLDMAVFGTGASLIYEDYESVIRCYNPPMGEYWLAVDDRGVVSVIVRKFKMKVFQYVQRWPNRADWSDRVKNAVQQGGAQLNSDIDISHIIAPNHDGMVNSKFEFYEMYWETRRQETSGRVLELRGYNERPGVFGRWEVSGTESYGVSPGMDALGDVMELQHLHRNKAELLEKTHRPPMLYDVQLQNNPHGILPGGETFVANLNNTAGARPMFTVNPNFAEINVDRAGIEERIRNTFYNFLFTGITNLQTVRSATEVDAREGEKLILLGGVLERFESEALDPAISRIFGIMQRGNLIPPPPEGFEGVELDVQYVSILSVAQRAVGTAPVERFLQVIGNLSAVRPDIVDLPNFDRMLTNYALDIGVSQAELNSQEEIAGIRQGRAQQEQAAAAMEGAGQASQAAKNLSETEVGGGGNALQLLLGSGG